MSGAPLKIQLVGLYTIVRKETSRVARIWVQTIVPPAITMSLYFVIFGNLGKSHLGPSMNGQLESDDLEDSVIAESPPWLASFGQFCSNLARELSLPCPLSLRPRGTIL